MIRLKSLELSNFRTFRESTVITFPDVGLIQIRGASGVGKSNIFEAIGYSLGYSGLTAAQVASWGRSESPCSLSLHLDVGDNEVEVRRDSKQYVYENGNLVRGSSKDLETKIVNLLGVSIETFRLLTYRPQQSVGAFIRLTDAEKKEFLTSVLDLEKYEKQVEVAQLNLKQLNVEYEVALGLLASRRANLTALEEIPKPTEDLGELEAQESRIKSLISETDAKVANWKLVLKGKLDTLIVPNKSVLPEEQKLLDVVKLKRQQYDTNRVLNLEKVAMLKAELKKKTHVQEHITKLCDEIATIQNDKCPTCKQAWFDGLSTIDQKNQKIADLQGELVRIRHYEAEIAQLTETPDIVVTRSKQELQEVEQRLVDFKFAQESQYTTKVTEIVRRRQLLQDKFDQAVQGLNIQLTQQELQQIVQRAAKVKTQEVLHQKNCAERSRRETELKDSEVKVALIKDRLQLEQDFVKLVGREGFLGLIFDEILNEIAGEANGILNQIPNTSNISVKFQSEALTQKGSVKRTIVLEVTINGNKTSWDKGCSGGQRTIISLAIDLALGSVLSRRSNVSLGYLILDEPMDGCDLASKLACLEMLKLHARDKLVIVVDHSVDTDLYDGYLTIINQNGSSRIDSRTWR